MNNKQAAEAMRERCARECEETAIVAKKLGAAATAGTLRNVADSIRALNPRLPDDSLPSASPSESASKSR